MLGLQRKAIDFGLSFSRNRWMVSPCGSAGKSGAAERIIGRASQANPVKWCSTSMGFMNASPGVGFVILRGEHLKKCALGTNLSNPFVCFKGKHHLYPCSARVFSSYRERQPSEGTSEQGARKELSTTDDPFDDLTYNIPQKPVTFVEGASYSIVILAGLGVAALAAYAAFNELIVPPKEYKIFGKALERVQTDSQVTVRIGSPVTGYGQESRNRAARQRIPNRVWSDEDGVEHVEVNFYIRGPNGAGKVYAEMFKDSTDKKWKFTYLIVEILSPTKAQLMLESYVPE